MGTKQVKNIIIFIFVILSSVPFFFFFFFFLLCFSLSFCSVFFLFVCLQMTSNTAVRLPPEVNRVLYVRNLPFKITSEEMYDVFGKYGPVRQIRLGCAPDTKGTAFVVYEDIFDAKRALEALYGFNIGS